MTENLCVCCGRPTPDGYACTRCGRQLGERLTAAAGHAEDAWTVIARQTRYGGTGGARKAEQEPARETEDERRNPVTTFGWAASVEKPRAGALVAEPTPVDLGALDRYHIAENTITTWARDLEADAGDMPAATRWLAEHVEDLRAHPAAAEAFDELTHACVILERLVDSPAERVLVGMCDCGKVLYAADGRQVVQCPEKLCQLRWDVDRSRDILREALREQLFTAAEAAHLAAYWDERTSEQIRKLINKWSERGRLMPHGWIAGSTGTDEARWPTYRFGDVIDRLATTERRRSRAESEVAA